MPLLTLMLILLTVGMICAGQILFKLVGLRLQAGIPILDYRVLSIGSVSLVIYGFATLLWIYVLKTTPLTKAYPYMALCFVLVPVASVVLFFWIERVLATLQREARARSEAEALRDEAALAGARRRYRSSRPFYGAVGLFVLAFAGLAYSLYPYLLFDRLTAAEAASATESLWMIFLGTAVVLPTILAYTVYSYRVFWGKADELRYD